MHKVDPPPLSPDSEKKLALLALMLDRAEITESRPTLLDIDLWRRGKLSKKRSQQVKAAVARDPDCFHQWLELIEAEKWLQHNLVHPATPSLSSRFNSWLESWHGYWVSGGLAVAASALFVTVLSLKTLTQPDLLGLVNEEYAGFNQTVTAEGFYSSGHDKSFPLRRAGYSDMLKTNGLLGVRLGLQQLINANKIAQLTDWQPFLDKLPQSATCPSDSLESDCQHAQSLLNTFGKWLLLAELQCRSATQSPAFNLSEKQQWLTTFEQEFSKLEWLSTTDQAVTNKLSTTDTEHFCYGVSMVLNSLLGE